MANKKQTALEWYESQRKKLIQDYTKRSMNGMDLSIESQKLFAQAKQMEKEQLYDAWDKAIEAHDKRGHNISRSSCDVDDYYEETYNTETDGN